MNIRPYDPTDEPAIRAIYGQRGYSFDFPDLNAADMVSIWVCEDEGRVVSAVAARKTVEVIAFVDPNYSTPAWRLETISRLQAQGALDLARQGFSDMHSWTRPELAGFGRRLQKNLGWIPSQGGTCFVRGIA